MKGLGESDIWLGNRARTDDDTLLQHADSCPNAATESDPSAPPWGRADLAVSAKNTTPIPSHSSLLLRVNFSQFGWWRSGVEKTARPAVPATSRSLADKGAGRFRGSVVGSNSVRVHCANSQGHVGAAQYLFFSTTGASSTIRRVLLTLQKKQTEWCPGRAKLGTSVCSWKFPAPRLLLALRSLLGHTFV